MIENGTANYAELMFDIRNGGYAILWDSNEGWHDDRLRRNRIYKDESLKEDLAAYIQKIHDKDEDLWLHHTDYNWLYDECAKYSDGFGSEGCEDSIADCVRRMPKQKQYEIIDRMVEPLHEDVRRRPVKEHFEKVEIETDTEKMEMTSEPGGKTVITTEPKEEEIEVIAPVSDELQSEINPRNDGEEVEDEMENEDDYEDIDVTEFSEEDFDELGESYLKKVYENVNSFKTNKAKISRGKLVVEGIIGFNSGKQKKTSFVFESKDVNKNGKVRFIGENLQFSRGKKSFTLTGSINEGKFIAESLNYNYRAKSSDGTSSRCYGTVKK